VVSSAQGASPAGQTEIQTISSRGSWRAATDGKYVAYLDDLGDGTSFIIIATGKSYDLAVVNKSWRLIRGKRYRITLTVDDRSFSGEFVAVDNTMLSFESVADGFLKTFVNGQQAQLEVGDYKVPISLDDLPAVIRDVDQWERRSA
jgi:hypothetical protein